MKIKNPKTPVHIVEDTFTENINHFPTVLVEQNDEHSTVAEKDG